MPENEARKAQSGHSVAITREAMTERTVARIVGLSLAAVFTLLLALNAMALG